jgi:alanine racemase
MWQYTVSEIIEITKAKISGKKENGTIRHIAIDSRRINEVKETLFVAIKGERHDGHLYIGDMIQKGIKFFLISDETFLFPETNDVIFLIVKDTISAIQDIAANYRAKFEIPVIAITGSNGKTIVKEWLSQALSKKLAVTRSPKSYNSQIGVPLSLMLLNQTSETGIFEAGISRKDEMVKLEHMIKPTFGIITNIGSAHQENFLSLEEKTREKLVLFRNCKAIYYCADHELISQTIDEDEHLKNIKKITWSSKDNEATIRVKTEIKKTSYTLIHITHKESENQFHIPFTDKASIENILHIINFLIDRDFDTEEINNAIRSFQPVAMRLEQVRGINSNLLINDSYNSDINSLGIAIDYLKQQHFHSHTLILSDIFQSGLSDSDLYKQVAELIQQYKIKHFIGVGNKLSLNRSQFHNINATFFETTDNLIESGTLNQFKEEAILVKGARTYNFEKIVSLMAEKNHTTLLEINLSNLISNLNYFRSLLSPQTGIMVMVKALAYGSGSYEIANLLQHEKVDYLGVAFTDEGVELRKAGITIPIMVMSPGIEDFKRIVEFDLEPEIYNLKTLLKFIDTVSSMQIVDYPVHLKIDTGMHRLGFQENEIEELIPVIKNNNTIRIKWIFSHLAASGDVSHDNFTGQQISVFNRIVKTLTSELGYEPKKHILNSAGIERFPDAHFNMVRLGIGLHGISSAGKSLLPVSTLKTHISQIKFIAQGETIGYNRSGKAHKELQIAIVPIGYADGLNRKFGNGNGQVIINNKKFPFIGDICMDMSMIDITGEDCKEGDEVVVFGALNPISLLARQIGTIPYEILTNISARVKRIYIKD